MLGMTIGQALGMSSAAAMSLGAYAGIAAVAINVLISHWDDLMGLMGLGRVKTEAEEMEELAKATDKTAEATRRLSEYERDRREAESLGKKRSSKEEATTHAYEEAVSELGDEFDTGFDKLASGLVQARRAAGGGTKATEEEQRILDAWQKELDAAVTSPATANFTEAFARGELEDQRKRIQERLDKEDMELAKKTVSGAAFDPLKRKQLLNEVKATPGAFPPNAAEVLAGAKPGRSKAEIERQRREEEEFDREAARVYEEQSFQQEIEQKGRENDRKFRDQQRAKAQQEADRQTSRFANALSPSVGSQLLANPKMTDADLQARVKEAMERAGVAADVIGRTLEETAKKLREDVKARVEARALEKNIAPEVAAAEIAREDRERMRGQGTNENQSRILDTKAYLDELLVKNMPGQQQNDIPEKQLEAQNQANDMLKQIADNTKKPGKILAKFQR